MHLRSSFANVLGLYWFLGWLATPNTLIPPQSNQAQGVTLFGWDLSLVVVSSSKILAFCLQISSAAGVVDWRFSCTICRRNSSRQRRVALSVELQIFSNSRIKS